MNCPAANFTGAAGWNSNSQLLGESCRLPTYESRMRRRCPAKNASRLPTSSANCGLDEIGPTWNATPNSTPTMPASTICCQRRGGSVSGSLSMKPAKKIVG